MPTITKTLSSTQRQGSYGGTRYHGKYNFGATGLDLATMNVDSAILALVATASGKSASRHLYLRQGTSKTGELIKNSSGGDPWVNRDTTNTIYLSTTQEASLAAMVSGSFGIYVDGSTDNYYFTDSTGNKYSSCYIKFSKATLTINWSYKNGTLNLSKTDINIGEGGDSSITATVSNYVSTYYYKIKVAIGDSIQEYELGNNSSTTLDFTKDIYKNWINDSNYYLFKNAKSLSGTITLTTYSDSNYETKLGNDSTVSVTFSAMGLISPTVTKGTVAYLNNSPYQGVTSFAIPGQGSIYTAFSETASQGATIAKRTITTNFSSNNSFSSSSTIAICKPDSNVNDGNAYSITITITDSRGDSAKVTFSSLIVQQYTPPKILITPTRILESEKQQLQVNYVVTLFEGATLNSLVLSCKDGADVTIIDSVSLTSSPYVSQIEDGISELEHFISITAEDSFGGTNTETVTLPSESFYLHFGASDNGISLGIGGAAPEEKDNVRCYWNLILDKPLLPKYGGTGATSYEGAWNNIVSPGGIIGTKENITRLSIHDSLTIFGQSKNDGSDSSGRIRFYDVGENAYYGGEEGTAEYPIGTFFTKGFNSSGERINKIQFMQSSPLSTNINRHAGGYEIYSLPPVSQDITGYNSYDILTTKNYPYNHKTNGNNNGRIFLFGTFKIQTGTVYDLNTSTKDAAVDTVFNFPESFSSIPTVVACFHAASSDGGHGKLSISVHSESTTGFTIRVNNGDTSNRAPNVSWIAIGLA